MVTDDLALDPCLAFRSCVTSGKPLNLSESQLPPLQRWRESPIDGKRKRKVAWMGGCHQIALVPVIAYVLYILKRGKDDTKFSQSGEFSIKM